MQEPRPGYQRMAGAKSCHPFEQALMVTAECIEFDLSGYKVLAWSDFLLNPRRLRGSDFLMRWSQGQWSEDRLVQAVNETESYVAVPYGPSGVAPDNDVRAFELYFERLESAGLGALKRPDLLIFQKSDSARVRALVERLGGLEELPFTHEDQEEMQSLLELAVIAVECENSLWIAKRMPDYGIELTPQKRLGGKMGLKKSAVLPTVIVKEQDREPLRTWQRERAVPVHVWHAFYDRAYGIAFDDIEHLITDGLIEGTAQTFQAPSGATSEKTIYKVYYQYAYPLGEAASEPNLAPAYIVDKNGHILPYVKFDGGDLRILPTAIAVLDSASERA